MSFFSWRLPAPKFMRCKIKVIIATATVKTAAKAM